MPPKGKVAKRPAAPTVASSYSLRSQSLEQQDSNQRTPSLDPSIARLPTPWSPRRRRFNTKTAAAAPTLASGPVRPPNPIPNHDAAPIRTQIQQSTHIFTESQLVLAAKLCRSKPPNLGWKEYFESVRSRRRLTLPEKPSERLCFDDVGFLKDTCNRLHRENNEKQAEIERLKLLLSSSEDKASQLRSQAESLEATSQSQRTFKHEARKLANFDLDFLPRPGRVLGELKSCLNVVFSAHTLHRSFSDPDIGSNDLLQSILATTRLLASYISSMEQDWLTAADEDAKMKTLRYFGGIYGLCLKGVKHLCRDILGRSQSGKAVYAMINLFSRILESSSRLCHASAVLKIEVSEGVLLSSVSLQGRIAESPSAVSSVLSAHTQFLASIFYSKEFTLTPRPKCYTEIMEGTAAILCAKLGRLLSFAVFNEPVADSTVPGHISMHPSPDPITELAMKIEREQMDAFLRLVKHRMKEIMSSSEELVNTPQLAKLLVGDAASTVHQGKLFEMASQKLQSTLCKALFGEDDGDFPNAIDTQVWGNDETEVEVDRQPSGEDDDRTKFLNSVWQLVGWDILEKR